MIDPQDWAQIEQFVIQRTEPLSTLVRQMQADKLSSKWAVNRKKPQVITSGIASVNWPGSATSDWATIAHGLGVQPHTVLVSPIYYGSAQAYAAFINGDSPPNATSFQARALALAAAGPGSAGSIWWLAAADRA